MENLTRPQTFISRFTDSYIKLYAEHFFFVLLFSFSLHLSANPSCKSLISSTKERKFCRYGFFIAIYGIQQQRTNHILSVSVYPVQKHPDKEMACPLNFLLNSRDVTPIVEKRGPDPAVDDDGKDDMMRSTNTCRNTDPSPDADYSLRPGSPGCLAHFAGKGYRYPVILSNRKRGPLYHRRSVRFSNRRYRDSLPTPPHSSRSLASSQDFLDQYSKQENHLHNHYFDTIVADPDRNHNGSLDQNDAENTCPPTPELDFRRFSIFDAMLAHSELVLELTRHLDIDDLVSLYTISINFHELVNARFTTMIRSHAEARAPEAADIFIFRCYRHLCIRDPASRPLARIPHQVRFVPGFRWLRMVIYRQSVAHDIVACLAAEGLFLLTPAVARQALQKIWFLLDIGDTARRIAILRNRSAWTDSHLLAATDFLVKLDMRLTDPRTGTG